MMANLEKFALFGKVYAYLNIIAAIYESAHLMLTIGDLLLEEEVSIFNLDLFDS